MESPMMLMNAPKINITDKKYPRLESPDLKAQMHNGSATARVSRRTLSLTLIFLLCINIGVGNSFVLQPLFAAWNFSQVNYSKTDYDAND